jgi:hypothetical protein
MTAVDERAQTLAAALAVAAYLPHQPADMLTVGWVGEALPEATTWLAENRDILSGSFQASWAPMDNGPLLTLRARGTDIDLASVLSMAFALRARFRVGVQLYCPAGLETVGVSVERISTNGFRVGGLRIDFSASARLAVSS